MTHKNCRACCFITELGRNLYFPRNSFHAEQVHNRKEKRQNNNNLKSTLNMWPSQSKTDGHGEYWSFFNIISLRHRQFLVYYLIRVRSWLGIRENFATLHFFSCLTTHWGLAIWWMMTLNDGNDMHIQKNKLPDFRRRFFPGAPTVRSRHGYKIRPVISWFLHVPLRNVDVTACSRTSAERRRKSQPYYRHCRKPRKTSCCRGNSKIRLSYKKDMQILLFSF